MIPTHTGHDAMDAGSSGPGILRLQGSWVFAGTRFGAEQFEIQKF